MRQFSCANTKRSKNDSSRKRETLDEDQKSKRNWNDINKNEKMGHDLEEASIHAREVHIISFKHDYQK